MKILQVVHYFPPSGLGGSELYTCQLSKELLKTHDVRLFFTIPDDNGSEKIKLGSYDGIPYRALKKDYCTFDQPFHERSKWVEREFTKTLDDFKPDIVHFQHLINLSLTLPSLAKRKGIATCFTLHDFWLLCPRIFLLTRSRELCRGYAPERCLECLADHTGYYAMQSTGILPLRVMKQTVKYAINVKKKYCNFFSLAWWRPYFIKKIAADTDVFIAPSHFLREKYIQSGMPADKILFCRHGFDQTLLGNIEKSPSKFLRFAYIGSILHHKGIHVLIDAFNRIPPSHELKIYGPLHPHVKKEFEEKITNPRVLFMGELKKEDKRKAFSEIDILILPSICYENCPIVINEAFMTKTPVIVSDLGGMAELVENGRTGFTFPAGDAQSLAEKINMFIRNPVLLQSLAAHIPAVKDMQTHAAELSALYKKTAGHHHERL